MHRVLDDPDRWRQRVGALAAVPRLLAGHGADTAAVLAAAGLPPEALSEPERFIPYASAARLFVEATRATGCPHFGLVIGAAWRLRDLGLLGELVRTGATVRDALQAFVAFHQLNSQGAAAYLIETNSHAELGYVPFKPQVDELAPLFDAVIAMGAGFVRELAGEPFRLAAVHLARAAPGDVAPYAEHFRCPVRFDAERSLMRFERAAMDRRPPGADAQLHEQSRSAILAALGDDFLPRVYRALRLQMLHGVASGDAVAQQLALQRRTFNRRLESHGVTFQTILDDVRYEVGRQLLHETDLPLVEVAVALGYEEAASFSRAFRRWSGVYPGAWRSARRADTPPG
jgi:AraC-like DNA-binding protein